MLRIERHAVDVATPGHPVYDAGLLGPGLGVVATGAKRGELLQRGKWSSAGTDAGPVVDRACRLDTAQLEARLTERVRLQLLATQALPSLSVVGMLAHPIISSIYMSGT